MKCINKHLICSLVIISILSMLFCGCGKQNYDMAYEVDSSISSFRMFDYNKSDDFANTFASNLCVVDEDIISNSSLDMTGAGAVGLFDVNNKNTIYAKNIHERLYPASLTKIMTALVALKYGTTDMLLTASNNVNISESGAQLCGLKPGDQMTLAQALHVLLIYSANDAAILIAEGIGGSVEGFVDMMNQEALEIGATNTHFMNPHGLSDDNHYTTAYDLYLMLNEAMKYEQFNEIIHMNTYSTIYYDKNGAEKEINVNSTNQYLQDVVKAPDNITVIGGKTGTTNAAGHCLALISKDTSGNPYISVILRSESRDLVYSEMTNLLGEISK